MASYCMNYEESTHPSNVNELLDLTLVIKMNLSDEQKEKLITLDRNDFARNLIFKTGVKNELYTYYGWFSITDLNILFLNKAAMNDFVGNHKLTGSPVGDISYTVFKLRKQGLFFKIRNLPHYCDSAILAELFEKSSSGKVRAKNLNYKNPSYINGRNIPAMWEGLIEPSDGENIINLDYVPHCLHFRGRWYTIEIQGSPSCFKCYSRTHVKAECPGFFCKQCKEAHVVPVCPNLNRDSWASRVRKTPESKEKSYEKSLEEEEEEILLKSAEKTRKMKLVKEDKIEGEEVAEDKLEEDDMENKKRDTSSSSENCKSTTLDEHTESSKTSLDSEKLDEIDFNVKDVHYKSNIESNKSYFTDVSYGGGKVLSSTPKNKEAEEWPGLIKENLHLSFFPKAPALLDYVKPKDSPSKKRPHEQSDTSDKSIQELVGEQINLISKKIKNKNKYKKNKNEASDKLLDISHADLEMFEKSEKLASTGVKVNRTYVDANGITCESGTINLETGVADVSLKHK